jgi:RNA polymerase sigma factor (sigma-70 family)
VDSQTDAELVMLARAGDKAAFGLLIERYQPMAKRAAMRMVTQEDMAQELAQEAMLRAYLSLGSLRDANSFRNWLYGIVLNVCRAYLRDQKSDFLGFDADAFPTIVIDPERSLEESDLNRRVSEAIHDLSPRNKMAVLLFYYDQLSLQEIAETLKVSVVAVKGRLHKARQQLKIALSRVDFEPRVRPKENPMIRVTIGDVVWMKIDDGSRSVILLFDEAGRRALPIWVGPFEAELLARGLHNVTAPRPLTFNFMASLLEASSAQLEEVRVETLKEDTYFAVAKVRSAAGVREVDARPSDVLSLAVLTGSPMFVSPDIPQQHWIVAEGAEQGKDADAIMNEIRIILEKRDCPKQFVSAAVVAKEENPREYLKRVGFLPVEK